MRPAVRILLALLTAFAVAAAGCKTPFERKAVTRAPLPPAAENAFKAQLESLALEPGEDALVRRSIRTFYERRDYDLAWSGDGGAGKQVDALVAVLNASDVEGLEPADYAIPRPPAGAASHDNGAQIGARNRDLALTRTFIRFARDLSRGRVDPATIDRNWRVTPREIDLAAVLEEALRANDFKAAVERLAPKQSQYAALRTELARYRELAASGGWPDVPGGPTLKPGMSAEPARLRALEKRLAREGYLDGGGNESARYGKRLSGAVAAFQRRHGLDGDGALGPRTLLALNVPAQDRVRQIQLNMERWRWLPDDLGERHILVNVPSFRLSLVEQGRESLGMNVIVGKEGWSTPLFSDRMTHIILNPDWNVPDSIAVDEILPKVAKDPAYLKTKNFEVTRAGVQVDPATIDWAKVPARGFPYRLKQRAGPENPLGRMKFMFPNTFNVYLHDTPAGHLFRRSDRAFSHGCIRVERPLDLAVQLVGPDSPWTRERILKTLETGQRQVISLRRPIRVYIFYWTAYADSDGMEFRNDLYGADRRLDAALRTFGDRRRVARAPAAGAGHAPRPRATPKLRRA